MISTVMLTYKRKFAQAARTLRHLSFLDQAILLVPKGERRSLLKMLQDPPDAASRYHRWVGGFPPYEIIEHDVMPQTSEGVVRYGALKHHATEHLLGLIKRPGDIGVMIDDDLNAVQGINLHLREQVKREQPWRDRISQQEFKLAWRFLGVERQKILINRYHFATFSGRLCPAEIRQRIVRLGLLAHGNYFTFAYSALPNNGLLQHNGPTPWVKFSGVLGLTHGVENPYHPEATSGEDWDAQGRILCDLQRHMIADPTTAFNMDIETQKYKPEGALFDDRIKACERALRYQFEGQQVFKRTRETSLGKLPSVTVTKEVHEMLRRTAA